MKLDYLVSDLNVIDDEQAIGIFRSIHWANGVYCPECKSFDIIMAGVMENLIGMFARNVILILMI